MTTPQVGYRPSIDGSSTSSEIHAPLVVTIAWAVLCLLVAQRVTSPALARALPAEHAGSGRSCLRRMWR